MSKTERISFIHSRIKKFGKVTSKEVVEEFEVNERTVRRDIEELRLMHNAPLVYNRPKNFYYYEDEFKSLDFLDDKILLYYSLINSITESSNYIPIVASEFKEFIEDKLSSKYLKIADKVSFQLSEFEQVKMEEFYKIFQSLIENKTLNIEYVSVSNITTKREVIIEKMINYSGAWYLLAYDTQKEDFRTFNLSRIKKIEVGKKIENYSITKEKIDEILKGSFGIFKGGTQETIEINFYEEIATVVKNQTWQEGQISTFDENTNILNLKLSVVDEREIIGKVLRYGNNAEIISPQHIRKKWINEIKKMAEKFCN